mmetsp:Transcript_37485/g.77772  ORF Transcript_37485/g.77772 Transcript_37485/m.77772 type:complete len:96 (-) Transcript_37485:1400-1687(-)
MSLFCHRIMLSLLVQLTRMNFSEISSLDTAVRKQSRQRFSLHHLPYLECDGVCQRTRQDPCPIPHHRRLLGDTMRVFLQFEDDNRRRVPRSSSLF